MTRRSRREIARSVEDLEEDLGSDGETVTFVWTETIVGSSWSPPADSDTAGDLDEGEQRVETQTFEVKP